MSIKITKIVLTGGPCAGKTTALTKIVEFFTTKGFDVYTLPEAATLFNQAGVNFINGNKSYFLEAEKSLLNFQLMMEASFVETARKSDKPSLIICDRGAMDIKAYMDKLEWENLISELGHTEVMLRDSGYDAVIHMHTAAKGAEKFYSLDNNSSRTENLDQARDLDDKLIQVWTGHPHLRIIGNNGSFEEKLNKTVSEIADILGVLAPIEKERKYRVEVIGDVQFSVESEIFQTYLKSSPDEEIRLRKRGENGSFIYFQTNKRKISADQRIETERKISLDEYDELLKFADLNYCQIHKNRKCFVYENLYFELDTFISPANELHILEIEGDYDKDHIKFPPFLKIIEDVTEKPEYYNKNLANITHNEHIQ